MNFLQIFLNSSVLGTQVLLLAAGLFLIHTSSRIIHIGLGGIMTLSAYTLYSLLQLEINFAISLILSIITGGFLSVASYFLLKDLIAKNQKLLGLIVSLCIWVVSESLVAAIFGSEGKFLIDGILPTYKIGQLMITEVGFWTIIIAITVVILSIFTLFFTPAGRILKAVKQHPECATTIGIKDKKVQIITFFIAGTISAIIGILSAMNSALSPTNGTEILVVFAFMSLIIGGTSDFRGTIFASYLIVLIPELLLSNSAISHSWKTVIVFIVTIVIVYFRPEGIFTKSIRKN